MKNKYLVFGIFVISLWFTSCQFSENLYLNEDGSGKIEFSFDASEIMQMAGDKMSEGIGEKEIDSTFTFKEILEEKKDSISKLPKAEQEKLKALEAFSVHMLMSEKEQKMNIDIFNSFKSVSDLHDMFTALNTVGDLKNGQKEEEDKNNPFASMFSGENSKLEYSFKNGVFKRTVKVFDKELQKQLKDSLGQAAMMLANSKYKLNYHFPKKVKSVSNDKALFSSDGKVVTIEYGLIEYLSDPEIMNLEVVLEN